MGIIFYTKRTFHSKVLTRNLFFCKEWAASFLSSTREKNFSFPIRAVNFCKTFSTCSPSSLGQDLTVKNATFIFIFSFGFLELKMAVLNLF
jgi:hypothetical protein